MHRTLLIRAYQSSLEFTYMEPEFIRVVAEEALANMVQSNNPGDLFTVECHRPTTGRQIVLLFCIFVLQFFNWRMTSASSLKRIFSRRPHHHLLVSFEQNVPSGVF